MDKHHEKHNQRRADLQNQQFDELWSLEKQLDQRQHTMDQWIADNYGQEQQDLNEHIDHLSQQLNQSGLQGWWFRLCHGEQAEQDKQLAQQSLDNLQWRMSEHKNHVQSECQIERESLLEKQHTQQAQLEESIANPQQPTEKIEVNHQTIPQVDVLQDHDMSYRPPNEPSTGRSR